MMRRMTTLLFVGAAALSAQSITINGSRSILGNWDASGAATTKPMKTGASLPASCSTGEAFFKSDAPGGQNVYICAPDNVWNQITGTGGGGTGVSQALIFDGSTVIPNSGMTSWTCGSGSAATCTTSWTVPSGLNWVRVQAWAGGGGGGGSSAGARGGPGGGGGGFWESVCPVTPGSVVTVTVGLGGTGSSDGFSAAGNGGNSSFGTCFTVVGGTGGNGNSSADWGGYLAGTPLLGWFFNSVTPLNPSSVFPSCAGTGQAGPAAVRIDGGGCGAGMNNSSGAAGQAGGAAIAAGGGGGSGGYNSASGGAGGVSAFGNTIYANGGNGGNGGGWMSSGGFVACTKGAAPGGGGGAAGTATSGGAQPGCNGGRGEVRVYYAQ